MWHLRDNWIYQLAECRWITKFQTNKLPEQSTQGSCSNLFYAQDIISVICFTCIRQISRIILQFIFPVIMQENTSQRMFTYFQEAYNNFRQHPVHKSTSLQVDKSTSWRYTSWHICELSSYWCDGWDGRMCKDVSMLILVGDTDRTCHFAFALFHWCCLWQLGWHIATIMLQSLLCCYNYHFVSS